MNRALSYLQRIGRGLRGGFWTASVQKILEKVARARKASESQCCLSCTLQQRTPTWVKHRTPSRIANSGATVRLLDPNVNDGYKLCRELPPPSSHNNQPDLSSLCLSHGYYASMRFSLSNWRKKAKFASLMRHAGGTAPATAVQGLAGQWHIYFVRNLTIARNAQQSMLTASRTTSVGYFLKDIT